MQTGDIGLAEFRVLEPLQKGLLSTSRAVKGGFRVVHDDISYMENKKTGAKHRIYERAGVYVLPVWIRPAPIIKSHTIICSGPSHNIAPATS